MARFMMVYKGQATDMSEMTPEPGAALVAAWGAWIEAVVPALLDVGTPFGAGTSIVDDGSDGDAVPLNGYSIVEAVDPSAAQVFADNHPFLTDDQGHFAIDVYEMMPLPFEG